MTQPKPPLSPAAQAVLDAMRRSYDHEPTRRIIAAGILRELAVQDETLLDENDELLPPVRAVRTDLILAIAAELENFNA